MAVRWPNCFGGARLTGKQEEAPISDADLEKLLRPAPLGSAAASATSAEAGGAAAGGAEASSATSAGAASASRGAGPAGPSATPKARARAGSRASGNQDGDVDQSCQVPKVVVDLSDMSEPTVEPVFVHVYDLGQHYVEYWRERLPHYSPFHLGLEVCGKEWSFGRGIGHGHAEVVSNAPGRNSEHKFRQTLSMGYSRLPPREVLRMLEAMDSEWNNFTFNLQTRNGHHFAETLCGRLGVAQLPTWLYEKDISKVRVFLRVYNLGQTFITRWHNAMMKSYGAFHTGVEVYGKEWCYGASQDDTSSVGYVEPGQCDQHDFRESLYMGSTSCTPEQVWAIIEDMGREWTGTSYDMFSRNCHNFSTEFCGRLGVSKPPPWVNELATALAEREARAEREAEAAAG